MKTFLKVMAVVVFLTAPFGVAKAQTHPDFNQTVVAAQIAGGCQGDCSNPTVPRWQSKVWWGSRAAPGTSASASCEIYDSTGASWTMDDTVDVVNGTTTFPAGTIFVSVPGNVGTTSSLSYNGVLKTGSLRCTQPMTWSDKDQAYEPKIVISVSYEMIDGQGRMFTSVGVLPVVSSTSFISQAVITPNSDTGIALVNEGGQTTTITLALYSPLTPTPQAVATATEVLGPNQQKAIFLSQVKWTPALTPDQWGNLLRVGSVVATSDGQLFAMAVLRSNNGLLGPLLTNVSLAIGP